MQLTFTTEELAKTALETINSTAGYPRPGVNAKTGEIVPGAETVTWANIQKAYELELWFFPEAPAEFMDGVTGYEKQELNHDWFEPIEDELV